MEYKEFKDGIKLSRLGMGNMRLPVINGDDSQIDYEKAKKIIDQCMENGINYYDTAYIYHGGESERFVGKAFSGCREKVITQMHFGAIYKGGKYGWTRKLDEIREQFVWELELLHTDYTDVGFIHCVDDRDDLDQVMNGGLWEYMKDLKGEGKIHHLGFSSHNPDTARRILETGLLT